MKKTKIVATLGPASGDEKIIEKMLKCGMNVARLNFSHGTHENHGQLIDTFRKVRDRLGLSAAVMLDTKGPEIRIKSFENGSVVLKTGDEFCLTSRDIIGNEREASITCRELPEQMVKGTKILLDDGKLSFEVLSSDKTDIKCKILFGGVLKDKKSINIPNFHIDMPYMSEQDKSDILFGIEKDVDFISASFVRCADDVIALRKFLDYHGGHKIKIISKIENTEGVKNFDSILKESDGVMVARGDMGVEIEFEKLPGIQKRFIRRCYSAGKIVITATQMLESMISSLTPTRAEISDVANAVFDGTSAVMLSGETTVGIDPANVVEVMAKIVEQAEKDALQMHAYSGMKQESIMDDTTNAVCDAACTTARDLKAKAIIAVTRSGYTARLVSKFRPSETIVGATPDIKTYHQLSMSWGVLPVLALDQTDTDKLFRHAIDCAKQIDAVKKGDTVVIAGGRPGSNCATDTLKVQTI